jgi:hypothetical protein
MRITLPALACIATLLGSGQADAGVMVTFANPAGYADARLIGTPVLAALRTHLQRLGAAHLARNRNLSITVLDIDLAGWDAASRGPERLRIMRGVTWPKMRVRYVLSEGRKVIASGEELISDHFYLSRYGMASSSDPLRHEKNRLDDWFRQKFSAGRLPAR